MTLYDYLAEHKDDEVTVHDEVYDIETYFYYSEEDDDTWDEAMMKIAKALEVVSSGDCEVIVNLYHVIEAHIEDFRKIDIFINCDTESIMDDIENIFAGNVSEKWLEKFASVL